MLNEKKYRNYCNYRSITFKYLSHERAHFLQGWYFWFGYETGYNHGPFETIEKTFEELDKYLNN